MFRWLWDGAGLVSVCIMLGRWEINVHLLPARRSQQWWYLRTWWDGYLYSFGLGPLLLLCWVQHDPPYLKKA